MTTAVHNTAWNSYNNLDIIAQTLSVGGEGILALYLLCSWTVCYVTVMLFKKSSL